MSAKSSLRRYERVKFHFCGYHEDVDLWGTVLIRGKEMVIDIPEDGASPYLLVGHARKHWFEAENTARAGSRVQARWVNLDDTFVGIWVEEGSKYLFRFELEPC